jgi:hypothetical protein
MTARRDQWHQLAAAMTDSNLPASDKAVFGFLLSKADWKTVELPARFTPTRKAIARKTSLSYRQVGYSTRHLERHGWLAAKGATGPGRPLAYSLALGRGCDCTGRVHVPQRWQPQQGTVATFGYRSVATNGGNAAGQDTDFSGGYERKEVEEAETAQCIEQFTIPGDSGGPADRDCFDDWLALISGRAVIR